MANCAEQDVIELGSSDDETEPAPKKKKPLHRAMVHIPKKLPEVTITPARKSTSPKINPVSIAKGNIGKAITVAKVAKVNSNLKLSNPFANKNIFNGKVIVQKPTLQTPHLLAPGSIIKQTPTAPIIKRIRRIPFAQLPIKIAQGLSTMPTVIPAGMLPAGITVKRTSQMQSVLKHNMKPNPVNIQVKRKAMNTARKKTTSDMVVVDLDDDDSTPNSAGPQWYLRPEEQSKIADKSIESDKKSPDIEKTSEANRCSDEIEKETEVGNGENNMEDQNNMESETPQYIEITIEDSPAKSHKSKRTCEVAELAITIDDSPIKGVSNKPDPTSGSDEETTSKDKHSKKKLEYPQSTETVEIEIELTPFENKIPNDKNTDSQGVVETEVVEIEESPLKPAESFRTSTPKKILPKTNDKSVSKLKWNETKIDNIPKPPVKLNDSASVPGEFHPVYQSFIDLCFRLENSEDMSKIVEKKIKAYYRQVPKEYTESEMFTDMVASKISAMKAGPEKMYLYIKDVVDELNLQRKLVKTQPINVVTVNKEQEKFLYGEESEFDSKRQRQIRKLEKTLKKLHRAIQKLEEQEVDFDDEEDSVYLLTERYKERMIRVHAKFCQLTNTKMPSEPRVQIDARPGQPKGPAKRLEKWINKKVPIGTPLTFPDFHDVLRCVREANQEDKLAWNEVDIMEEARDLFTRCGKKLQRRRQENEWRLAASRIQSERDPAEESEALKKALEDNSKVATKKESEVLKKYADRQKQLKLEAVEIGDKEAEESPQETDDEEPTEESASLETKEKRKERLKRLLKKPKKVIIGDDKTQKEQTNETEKLGEDNEMKLAEEKDPLADGEKDVEKDPINEKQKDKEKGSVAVSENVQTLSEDSSKIDSDIDELHLLQKLHSNVIDSSTLESSDSESAIAISDTLSSGDNRKRASDVISIENSSYSESEKNNEQENEIVSCSKPKIVTESVDVQIEIECSEAGVEKTIKKSNNDEYNESVEDILLASSDDEENNDIISKAPKTPTAIDGPNVEESEGKNTKSPANENTDNINASSMESVEMTATNNIIQCESSSVTSTETAEDANAEVTSINSVEIVEDVKMTGIEENIHKDVAKSVESTDSVKDTHEKPEDVEKEIGIEDDRSSEKDNKITSKDVNKNSEITRSKLSDSVISNTTADKQGSESNNTKTIANVKSVEKATNDLPVPEPMEVDQDNT